MFNANLGHFIYHKTYHKTYKRGKSLAYQCTNFTVVSSLLLFMVSK